MFLYRLELQGFKSFADKTEVLFGNGVTGVIGPNGCGKTNVSDAIRWVMGEQSARQLRGDTMEDVIFNGSPSRKPHGMAEVHLTFKNDRGILPTEFSEVMVSRRVFRSGLSEYFINKTPCRLKDIRDLFFDTGMGSHAYSVIERSMVDQVLSDSSGHRRFLFEEAAGITKYKARKKETLSKLDATEADLTRLHDIVFEIERELRSLARQVGKARRYQRLRDEAQRLDLQLTAGRVDELRAKEKEAAEQWQEEAVRREGAAAELDALEAHLNDEKLVLLELERELSTAQAGLRDREEARGEAEHQNVLLGERAAGLERRGHEAEEEATQIEERLSQVAEREREAQARLADVRAQRAQAEAELAESEAELAAVDGEIRERRTVAADHRQLSLDLFSAEAEKRGAWEAARARLESLEERSQAVSRAIAELETRVADLAKAGESGDTQRRGLAAELDESRRLLAEAERTVDERTATARAAEETLSRLREEAAAADSRLQTLLELKRNYEGVSEGARALLAEGDRVPGLLGMVADVLEVPARFLDALEASLGEAAAFVLAEDRDALGRSLERLRGLESGRATLIDMSAIAGGALPTIPAGDGVLGRASELVRCEARFRALVDRLLGSVVMVEDRETAARLSTRSEGGLRFVSLDAEVWERGRVRAGSTHSLAGLLHREMEIREISGRLAEQRLDIEGRQHELEDLEARRADDVARRTEAQAVMEARRDALEALHRELEGAERERRWALAEMEERRTELHALDAEREALGRASVEAERELTEFQEQLAAARSSAAASDGELRALEARREASATAAQGARDRLLTLSRDAGEWEAHWARAEQTRHELDASLAQRRDEVAQARARVAEIQAEQSGIGAGLAGLRASEEEQRARVKELLGRFARLKEEAQAGETRAREKRLEQTELSEFLHQIEIGKLEAHAELERTFERLRTEYKMDPARWSPEPAPEGFDRVAAERELGEIRERLGSLGPVNLLAVEEYQKRKERYEFLTRQREDLLAAKAQLLEAIEKINTTASQLFVDTFAKVQVHFRDVFRTLFEGGDAELRAIGEDPLECEIEIVAKPRGKHLQSISLMSGGERALTAIALLFAIYLVKPSPFCLLDEVDAPLDDANVERFLKMLQRFSERTQFVVITHNKVTMEAAGLLYGVTMQELGVSKLVSVRFDRRSSEAGPVEAGELTAAAR
jgi:chromosome segregation protein